MNGGVSQVDSIPGHVTFRYWASARAAAGVTEEQIAVSGPTSLAALIDVVAPGRAGLVALLGTCSVLIEERPVASQDPAEVLIAPGQVVEFLPPFAGG